MNSGNAIKKIQKTMLKPIVKYFICYYFIFQHLLFRLFFTKTRVQVWLYEQADLRFEGLIIGFDEYMNLVMEDSEEINVKRGTRSYLGRILLKGDNLSLIRPINENNFSY